MMKRSLVQMQKLITTSNLNPNVLKTQYAVRGQVVMLADQLRQQLLNKNHTLPFNDIVFCNIGNPQQLAQKPLTFFRQVLACVVCPELLDKAEKAQLFEKDVFERARQILSGIDGSSGAYTHSQGLLSVRRHVARFIEKRDGLAENSVNPDYLFLTDGASVGVRLVLQCLIRNAQDGVMIPIPQYPLYSAGIQAVGGAQVSYYLNEEQGWGLDVTELERSHSEATKKGVHVRALVIINPGNPTGQVLSKSNMQQVVQFCKDKGLVLLADEVYQENVYTAGKHWYSFSRVVEEMGLGDTFEMISYHSVSKGFLGECGRRGGYFQLSRAFDKDVKEQFYKMSSINLCPNVDGQVITDLMVLPPQKGDPSYDQYEQEKNNILQSLKRRAEQLTKTLNQLPGIKCNPSDGAMYAFPRIDLPPAAVQEAQANNMHPDMFYSLELLRHTGICVVPGSGFGQKDGTYHFRTTFLPPEDKIQQVTERLAKFHTQFMQKYSNKK
jgi:alanine transaminase